MNKRKQNKCQLNRGRALCYFDFFRLADYYLRLAEQQGENQITDENNKVFSIFQIP